MGARVVHVRRFGPASLGALVACAICSGTLHAAGPEVEAFTPPAFAVQPPTGVPDRSLDQSPNQDTDERPDRSGASPERNAIAASETPSQTRDVPNEGREDLRSSGRALATNESLPLGLPPERRSAPIAESTTGAKPANATGSELRTFLALGGVVGAILAIAWGAKRVAKAKGGLAGAVGAGGRSPAGLLSVLGRYPIARGQTLILLRLDRRVLLLSQTWARGGARLSTLAEITDPEEVASVLVKAQDAEGESVSERFRAIVERLNHEPSERAVTVVAPVAKGDWFERVGVKARREQALAPAARVPSKAGAPDPGARAAHAARGHADGAAALRSRLEAMRSPGGRVA